jgi:hypothetical protein
MARSATTGLDTYYGDEPWSAWDINQRAWYIPELQRAHHMRSNYGQMVPVKVDFTAQRTGQIIWTGLYDLEPSIDSIGLRDIWLKSQYTDGWRQSITMHHYGDKMALHKYDPLVTFFTAGGGAEALSGLVRELLSNSIIDVMEAQIRNAFLSLPVYYISGGGTGGFSEIAAGDVFDPELAMDIQLNFAYSEVVDPNAAGGLSAVMYASPGMIHSAQSNSTFIDKIKYASEGVQRLFRYEMGAYKGIRYLQHPINTLWNCGEIVAQAPVTTAITAGDGAPDPTTTKVLGVYEQGQRSGSQAHHIHLGSFSTGAITDLKVNDTISIHTRKSDGGTMPYDIVGAPLPTDGTKLERRIQAIDTGTGTITLDKPIMRDYNVEADNDCSAGEYAFVTKGRHIHAGVIVAAPGAVVGGFAQPPQLHTPPAVDDLEAMYRFAWDGYYDYSPFRTEAAVVVYSAGYTSYAGKKAKGGDTPS